MKELIARDGGVPEPGINLHRRKLDYRDSNPKMKSQKAYGGVHPQFDEDEFALAHEWVTMSKIPGSPENCTFREVVSGTVKNSVMVSVDTEMESGTLTELLVERRLVMNIHLEVMELDMETQTLTEFARMTASYQKTLQSYQTM